MVCTFLERAFPIHTPSPLFSYLALLSLVIQEYIIKQMLSF